jgi:CheY-like chemotaxis protein
VDRILLLIEDNPNNSYLMRYLLEKAGFTVLEATSGVEGIDLALRYKPDAVLLDIQLPEMNGYEVLSAMRSDCELSGIPVIAVTSYAMAGDRERIMHSGADGYIEKPIDPDSFVATVSANLRSVREKGEPV